MEYHEAAKIFPMDEDSLQELADDIAKHGLLHPIEVFEGKIIDGRRRSAACLLAGVEPDYSEVNPADPIAYVLSLNLHRRHLTESQRGMIAAKVIEYHENQAKDRQREAGRHFGRGKEKVEANWPQANSGKSSDQVGDALAVGGRTVRRAKRVASAGAPEVIQAVESGKLSLNKAEQIVLTLPKEQQAEAVKETIERNPKHRKEDGPTSKNEEQNNERRGPLWERAINAKTEVLNFLQRSKLVRLGKNNPHAGYAFDEVIRWLRSQKKDLTNG
jgi:ParB-like chromosome segregation protein Spo0J